MDTVYSCIFLIFMWKEMEYEGLKCLQKVRKKFEKSSKKVRKYVVNYMVMKIMFRKCYN